MLEHVPDVGVEAARRRDFEGRPSRDGNKPGGSSLLPVPGAQHSEVVSGLVPLGPRLPIGAVHGQQLDDRQVSELGPAHQRGAAAAGLGMVRAGPVYLKAKPREREIVLTSRSSCACRLAVLHRPNPPNAVAARR